MKLNELLAHRPKQPRTPVNEAAVEIREIISFLEHGIPPRADIGTLSQDKQTLSLRRKNSTVFPADQTYR